MPLVCLIIALLLSLTPTTIAPASTPTSTPAVPMQDLPVTAWYCETDPGLDNLFASGRGVIPEDAFAQHGCERAEGVGLTFSWDGGFARCDTGATGTCKAYALSSPTIKLRVAVHWSTVRPGYVSTPNHDTVTNYTEFSEYGIAFVPADNGQAPNRRRTLAFEMLRDGQPTPALTQLSPAGIDERGYDWLGTTPDGWVSYDISDLEPGSEVDLVVRGDASWTIRCDHDTTVSSIEGIRTPFLRLTIPPGTTNITCRASQKPVE